MSLRTLFAVFCLLVTGLGTTGQEVLGIPSPASVKLAPATSNATNAALPINAPSVSAQKLTDASSIIARFATNNTISVVVVLVPPSAAFTADLRSKLALSALRPQIRNLQESVLTAVPASEIKVGFRFENIAGFSAEVSADGLKALQANPQVASIEPVHALQPHLAQGIPLMQGMTYRSTYNGAGMAIAICDTGIDYNHPRLGGGGFPNGKVLGGYDFGDADADPIPNSNAHGTCCAGIAAGDLGTVGDYIGGVAYNAKLYALKISAGSGGSATTDAMVAAWDWCVTHKDDDPGNPIMVISTSFGGGRYFSSCDSASPSMATAANNAVAAGITVLVSSGNDGYCDSMGWPACISSVISVGAVYDAAFGTYQPCVNSASCAPKTASGGCSTGYYATDSTAADMVTSYANVASFLTLLAPANRAYTVDIVGADGYSSGDYFIGFGGTSAACPYAAGAVACLQSAAKAITGSFLTPAQVRAKLLDHGDNITDTKVAITKPRVNLQQAIESVSTNPVLNVVSVALNGGNGNGTIDPNECNGLSITIRNGGFSDATNISATLTATSPEITIVQPDSTYPDLGAGASGDNTTVFIISTSPTFSCSESVDLTLILSYGSGTNTNSFSLISGNGGYVLTTSSGTIVPGTTDIGNHDDDLVTSIALPFPYTFYSQTFSNAALSSNGNLQFLNASNAYNNSCLPFSGFNSAIMALWDDLRTDANGGGIFTSTTGNAPNRIFNIEWRATYYTSGAAVNFEIRLYEGQRRLDILYGTLNGSGNNATVGIQQNAGSAFTQFSCNSGALSAGLQLTFQPDCTDGGGACIPTVANFDAGPTNGLSPLTVNFTNLSAGATGYEWDFGDGNTSTDVNPANTYANAGVYSVTLTALGVNETNSLTLTNLIVVTNPPPPIADFVAAPTNGLAPLMVFFTNLSTGAAGYEWDFGDSNTSTDVDPANTYTNAGVYNVTLVAIGTGGTNQLVFTNYIVVTNLPPPVAGFMADLTSGIAPLTVNFTNLSMGATRYEWDFGDGNTSTDVNPVNTYSNAGTFSVTLAAIGTSETNSLTLTNLIVVTNPPPPVTDFVAAPTNGLAPLLVFFTNFSTGAAGYEWDFGDGNTSADVDPANTYTNAGIYSVTLVAIGAGGTNQLVFTNYIAVTNEPPPVPDFVADVTNGIAPLTVNFTNLSTGAAGYEWDFGDGNTSTDVDPVNTYTNAGVYSVTLVAIGAGGTNQLFFTNYIVATNEPPPVVDFVADVTSGTAPLTANFTNLSTGATGYEWDFGDGNTGTDANPVHTYTNAGTFSVTLAALGASETNSLTLTNLITVTNPPPPVADFVAAPTNGVAPLAVFFTNLSTGATSYEWDFGDGNISTDANPSYVFTNAGSYTVTLVAIGDGGTNALTLADYIESIAPAQLVVQPATLHFGLLPTGAMAHAVLVVSNAGAANLVGTAAVDAGPFAMLGVSSNAVPNRAFDVAGLDSTNIIVQFSPQTSGAFTNTIVFGGNGGDFTNTVSGMSLDALLLAQPAAGGTDFTFSFPTLPGVTYDVEYKDSLADPNWLPLQSANGDGNVFTITNSILSSGQRFFRVIAH